jgi:hypothetical protein
MRMVEIVEDFASNGLLTPGLIAHQSLHLLNRSLVLPDGIEREYISREYPYNDYFLRAGIELIFPSADLAKTIEEFTREYLQSAMEQIAAQMINMIPEAPKKIISRALPMPCGIDFVYQVAAPEYGLGLRIIRAYDIQSDSFPCRFDVLFKFE